MQSGISRRTFHQFSLAGAAGLTALQATRVMGANDRIRLGCIGVGNRGKQVLSAFLTHSDVEVVALCDVSKGMFADASALLPKPVEQYGDFRKVLDRKNIDAVIVATPDHWHAIQTIAACNAGKDVYVEKPLSITIHEGRRMVEAVRRTGRVVQVGIHRRSSRLHAELAKVIAAGTIGKVTYSRGYRLSNMFPDGIGRCKPSPAPQDLDWDMWLGPRPARPFQENICPYKFRWWHLYSSQMGNWGVHRMDAIRWLTGELAPSSVCAFGGRFAVDDDRTIPDTMEAMFQFASGRMATFTILEASGNPFFRTGELELRGTQGTAYIDGRKYEIVPEKGGQFQTPGLRMKPLEVTAKDDDNAGLTAKHARNFLDCVRSRQKPNCDIETGHRSTTFSHLANISLAVGSRIEWDAEKETIRSPHDANQYLHYEYRAPWKLE